MVDESSAPAVEAPATKRQRTDDGPATAAAAEGPARNAEQGGQRGGGAQQRGGEGQQQGGQQQEGRRNKRKQRDLRIPHMLRAVKHKNLEFALTLFRAATADGLNVPTGLVNSLMFLACGGEQWERLARGLPPLSAAELAAEAAAEAAAAAAAAGGGGEAGGGAEGGEEAGDGGRVKIDRDRDRKGNDDELLAVPEAAGPPSLEQMHAAVDELYGYMKARGLPPDQTTYLGLARREALRGDPQAALQWVRECSAKGDPVQLRLFHPAQVGFCLAGDVASLELVDRMLVEHRLDPTEYEYGRMLEGIAVAGSYGQLRDVLKRMQGDLNRLSPATAAFIEAFFTRPGGAAQAAFAPPSRGGCPLLAAARRAPAPQATTAAVEAAVAVQANGGGVGAGSAHANGAGGAEAAGAEPGDGAAAGTAEVHVAEVGAGAAPAAEEAVLALEAAVEAAPAEAEAVPALEAAAGVAPATTEEAEASTVAEEAVPAAVAEEVEAGEWRWRIERGVSVAADGQCEAAGGRLRVIDLEEHEWDDFAEAIAELARRNMGGRAADFDAYASWYDRHGPYDLLVDAANVSFFGQNHEGGGFSWGQLAGMVAGLRRRFPERKLLVMLHRKRLNDPEARAPSVQRLLDGLKATKSFYYTPSGANDDWFWLYACVRAKRQGLLVSNDELRDHIFSLLRPRHFLKWKERHIAHYDFAWQQGPLQAGAPPSRQQQGGGEPLFTLTLPAPYTSCVQQLAESGAWMVPLADGGWMCVRPERV